MMTRMPLFLALLTALFTLCALPTTAVAQESTTQQVEQLAAEGVEAFQAGDYETAIDRFGDAYDLQAVPNLLFNIGRAYEGLEDWENAKKYFDRFVRSPDVDSDSRETALDRIQSLREIQAAEDDDYDADDVDDTSDEEMLAEPEPADLDRPSRLPAFSALGGGAILLAGGTTLGLMARSNANTMEDSTLSLDERRSAQSSASTQAVVADIFFVSGLAATAVGTYLFLNLRSSDDASAVVSPWTDGDSSGLGFSLDF